MGAALLATSGGADPPEHRAERTEYYVYAAAPQNADGGSAETHRIRVTTDSTGTAYSFHTERSDVAEVGTIRTTAGGAFVSAVRYIVGADSMLIETDSIFVHGPTLVMTKNERGEDRRTKRVNLDGKPPLAVDASLLIWLRSLPPGESATRELFMADWSQRTVDVEVHDRGPETVTVPAGTFVCHRIEVVVKVFVFRPKINFWISAEPPHFLVKHRGKRGPFTPVFETGLVEKGQP